MIYMKQLYMKNLFMDKPYLQTATFKFAQEGNTDGTTSDTEELLIEVESVGNLDEDGGYFVLRTNGWSINDSNELDELFERIKNFKLPK